MMDVSIKCTLTALNAAQAIQEALTLHKKQASKSICNSKHIFH